MDFSEALTGLKAGKRVSRTGWNGKGMWLVLTTPERSVAVSVRDLLDLQRLSPGCELLPWIGMKTADNKFVPWLASQTDILAGDWGIVNDTGAA